ncbi:hypothetical protein [Halonotius aquaticus]|uniref:hypothetical protein n=1 Tax=Halonotius aquaticus TaxID=2216978 RepID=UPI001058B2DB|nr:hypothetical protein [Halonotius aquaticus]
MARGRGGSGGLSRRAALALISGGGLLGISSTGAFDQVGADRAFDISVDDNDALLGVTLLEESFEVSEGAEIRRDLLKIENRSSDSTESSEDSKIEFNSVKIEAPDYNRYVYLGINTEKLDGGLAPETSVTIPSTISGKKSTTSSIPIKLTITASSDEEGIVIETTRTVYISVAASGYEPGTCPVTFTDSNAIKGENVSKSVENENVDGDIESNSKLTIRAKGDGSTVSIKGNVSSSKKIDIKAQGGTITIGGDVNSDKVSIKALQGGSVTICGTISDKNPNITKNQNGSVSINGN